jgi:DNA repair exonuclease SbcCD nuclease subunit
MITAVLTSDNHLGAYYSRFRPDRLEGRRRFLQRGFEQVVDAAVRVRADLFLHAGDLFDRPDPRNAERCFVARQVRRLQDAEIPVFAIAGNHDSPRSFGYDGGALPHEEMEALGAIHLFGDRRRLQRHEAVIRGQRVSVWGMSCDVNRPVDACPLEECGEQHERGGDLDLVLLHHGVEGWAQPFAQEPCLSLANLDRLGTDAVCVGHLHARNEARLPNGALLLNPGSTEHVHFGEELLDCGFWVLRCEPGRVEAEYVRLTPQKMWTLPLDLTDGEDQDPEALLEDWLRRLEEAAHPEQLLRVRVRGRVKRSRFHGLNLAALQARGGELNFHCQLDTEALVLYDEGADLGVGIGFSFDAGEELQSVAAAFLARFGDDPEEQALCRAAGERIAADYARLTGGAR